MNELVEYLLMFVAFVFFLNFMLVLMFNSIFGARIKESVNNNEGNNFFNRDRYQKIMTIIVNLVMLITIIFLLDRFDIIKS